jgi:hypothetical protein
VTGFGTRALSTWMLAGNTPKGTLSTTAAPAVADGLRFSSCRSAIMRGVRFVVLAATLLFVASGCGEQSSADPKASIRLTSSEVVAALRQHGLTVQSHSVQTRQPHSVDALLNLGDDGLARRHVIAYLNGVRLAGYITDTASHADSLFRMSGREEEIHANRKPSSAVVGVILRKQNVLLIVYGSVERIAAAKAAVGELR